MADWDISPTGVASVLKKVGTHAEELGKELNTLSTHAESAVTATQSNLIGTTISEYFEKTEGPRLKKISSLVSAACTGVRDATKAYLRGDEEMAADAQDKAIKAGAA